MANRKTNPPPQNLPGVRSTVRLAPPLGTLLGDGALLLPGLPATEG
jgi:hypothetical protein